MMYFLSVVLIGTVYPIFLDVISSEQISVGPPFYHKLIIPFLIPFLIFMAVGPQLRWIKSSALEGKKFLVFFLILSFVISFLIIKNFGNNLLINTVLIGSALYLFFITVRDFFKKRLQSFSQNLAHFGFSLLILSILFNNMFSTEVITNLKVGESYQSKNFKINFERIDTKKNQNFEAMIGMFSIDNLDGNIEILKPE